MIEEKIQYKTLLSIGLNNPVMNVITSPNGSANKIG